MTGYNRARTKNNWQYLFLVALPLAVYAVFFIYCNLNTLLLSLYKWDGLGEKVWVGLKNFYDIFTRSKAFSISLRNTIIYTIVLTVFQNLFGLILALLLQHNKRINRVLRTAYFLPAIFSSVAIGFLWGFIYDPNLGILNKVLEGLGLGALCRAWLGEPSIAIYSIAMVHVWVGIGYSMVLFVAGLQQIPQELYEAASIEGAGAMAIFRRITLPLLKPTILTLVVLCTIGSFKAFDYVYILTGGGSVGGKAEVLATLIYKEGFAYSRLGFSSSLSVVLLVVVSIISLAQMYLLRDKE
ncbi:MAG: carbohydrate ABC transporter permease [Candidatus Excrementavichristensenella sp.]|jgi:raffinose/stachyose/melibiose transport system permease protein